LRDAGVAFLTIDPDFYRCTQAAIATIEARK
jgi:hypothetical protein